MEYATEIASYHGRDTQAHAVTLAAVRKVAAALAALRTLLSNDPTHLAFVECLAEALAKPAPDVNAAGPDGATALLLACARGDGATAEELLSLGADHAAEGMAWRPDYRASDGVLIRKAGKYPHSPLTMVAFNGNSTIAMVLLARNDLDVNQLVDDGRTALSVAAQFGQTNVVKLMLAHDGIDANKARTDNGATSLYMACQNGHDQVVKLLLAHNDIDANKAETNNGITPLHIACQYGHDEVVKLLLAHDGMDANKARTDDGCTPLSMACQDGHDEIVKLLLAHAGMDANKAMTARTADGCTPLYMACQDGHDNVVKLLLAHDGIDANKATTDDGTTPLHAAVMSGNLLVAQHLVTCGADMSTTDNWNETAAQYAAGEASQPALAVWLDVVASWSSLRVAAGCRLHRELATLLRQGRIDPDSLTIPEILAAIVTAKTQPAALPWDDAPPVCRRTVALVADATRGWHRSTHWLHHAKVREAVFTVLVAADRLYTKAALPQEQSQQANQQRRPTRAAPAAAAEVAIAPLPTLPPEIWLHCLGFVLRSWWAVYIKLK